MFRDEELLCASTRRVHVESPPLGVYDLFAFLRTVVHFPAFDQLLKYLAGSAFTGNHFKGIIIFIFFFL